MKKLVLDKQTKLNAILVVDKKNSEVFSSKDLNMTLEQYITRSIIMSITENAPSIPHLYDMELDLVISTDGKTSKGYHYKSSAYKHENDDILVFVNVIDWVEDLVEQN